jgi:hypothetical protein
MVYGKGLAGAILLGLCAAQLSACIAARPRDGVPTQLISAAELRGYSDDTRFWGDSYASYPAHQLVAFHNERLKAARTDPSIKLKELNALTLSGDGSMPRSRRRAVYLEERQRIVDSRRDPRTHLSTAAACCPRHSRLGHLRKRASMHDPTATLSHVVCQGVQRMRLLDFIPGTPFVFAGRAREIPAPASSSPEIEARLLKLRRMSIDLLIARARALVPDEELLGYRRNCRATAGARRSCRQSWQQRNGKALLTPSPGPSPSPLRQHPS